MVQKQKITGSVRTIAENSTRTQNSFKNMVYGLLNKVVSLFLSLANRYIFLRVLPIEYLGINGVFSDVLTMLSLSDLGFATAMAYSFYKPLAEHDENKLIALMTFYRKVYHIIALCVAVLGVCIVPFLDVIIHVDYEIEHIEIYYLIALFNTVVSYLFAYKQSIITADQKYHIISKYSMWIAFAKISLQMLVLYASHNYMLYLLVGVVTTIAYNLLVNHQANKYYPFIRQKGKLDKRERKEILNNTKSLFIYKIAGVIMSGTDNTLISVMISTASVGLYTNYMTVVNRIVQLAGIILSSLTASIGNYIAEESSDKSYQIFKAMQICSSCLAGFIVIELYVLLEDFIRIWLGAQYLTDKLLLAAILCNVYYSIVGTPVYIFREASGQYKQVRYIMLICALLNLILSVIMGQRMGMAGIVFATFIAKVLTSFWYEARLMYCNFFKKKLWTYFRDIIVNIGIGLLTLEICVWAVDGLVINKLIWWIIKGTICAGIIIVIYVMAYGWRPEMKYVFSKIRGRKV